MSNSSLVNYTKISPNSNNPRKYPITKITIHHAAGVASVEGLGSVFSRTSTGASANYGIGADGRVGMYVEEANRAWTSSNRDNDERAITIEVANSAKGGNWPVSDLVLAKLIDLCVDICQRNGIERLNYTGDKTGNLTRHNMFAATTCPGPYLQSKFPYIAEEVNKRLGSHVVVENQSESTQPVQSTGLKLGDEVKLIAGAKYSNGRTIPAWLFKKILYVRELQGTNVVISTLKSGAITGVVASQYLTKNGQTVVAPTESKPAVSTPTNTTESTVLSVGDVVKLISGAKYINGKSVPAWLLKKTLYVRELQGDNVVISTLKFGAITGVVAKKYLTKNGQSIATTTTTAKPTISTPVSSTLSVGDQVKLIASAKYANGGTIPAWLFKKTLYVRELQSGDKVVISTLKSGAITGVVLKQDLTKI